MFHNMTDKDWKEFVQAESDIEAERIMRQVASDPSLKDVHAPEELFDALMEKIREYEDRKAYEEAHAEYVASGCKSTPAQEFWEELGLNEEAKIVSFEEAKKRRKENPKCL